MKYLHIAENLKLPLEAVTQTFAILAMRGVGKTHTGSVMAEEMLKAGQPIVVYDPTGAWWGLKSSADGKRPGFPVVVFGGEHADVPLEETAGATIAGVIVEKRIPAILDCGLLRKGARIRFMTEFCETLYHKNREALHFFVDEAHTIAPQNLKAMPEAARLLGAMEDIILQGRRRGLGATIISQRPALVNKNITTQCDVLIAMRVISAQDRAAIKEWIDVHADNSDDVRELTGSLASLPRGEGWLWSPGWLGTMQRVAFRQRETFDSSATPAAGKAAAAPKAIAAIDVAKLGQEIAATIEKAKADDPKELRRQIAELKKQAACGEPRRTVGSGQWDKAEVETAVAAAVTRAVAARDREWQPTMKQRESVIGDLSKRLVRIVELANVNGSVKLTPAPVENNLRTAPQPIAAQPVKEGPAKKAVKYDRNYASDYTTGDRPLSKAERAILTAFYWLRGQTATPSLVAFYSGYSASSSTWDRALGKLRHGLVNGWTITAEGAALVESWGIEEKPTGPELREWLRPKLDKAANAVLDALIAAYPSRVLTADLAAAAGYSSGSSTWDRTIGRLRSLEAAEGYDRDGGTKAADVFFDE